MQNAEIVVNHGLLRPRSCYLTVDFERVAQISSLVLVNVYIQMLGPE